MKKTYIVYNSLFAESICSAMIVIKKNASAVLVDLHGVKEDKIKSTLGEALGTDFTDVYVLVDDVKDKLPKSEEKSTIIYTDKSKTIDGHKNKRVALLWKSLFPDIVSIPQCIHHVSGLQLSEDNKEKAEWFKLAVVANLSNLTDDKGIFTREMQAWLNMMSKDGDIDFLRTLCSIGSSIDKYIKKTGVKAPEIKSAPSNKPKLKKEQIIQEAMKKESPKPKPVVKKPTPKAPSKKPTAKKKK